MNSAPDAPATGRTAQKRRAILDAATAAFLQGGFRGTNMDEIAARARASKQTVYKQFGDKEALFREIIAEITGRSETLVASIAGAFGTEPAGTAEELELRLRGVARALLDGVLQPKVLALRRLIIAEAEQFPDLAGDYYEQAPARGIGAIAGGLRPYVASGLLRPGDLQLAAAHFAYLAVSIAQDRALFLPAEKVPADRRESLSAAAARVFLGGYGAG